MAVPAAVRLTIEEFSRLPQDGERHELSAGELSALPPRKFLHSRVAKKVFKLLEAQLEKAQWSETFEEAGYVLPHDPLDGSRELAIEVITFGLSSGFGS